jgi:hypothetical protein
VEECDLEKKSKAVLDNEDKTRQNLGIKKQPTRRNNVAYSFTEEVSIRGLNPFVYKTIGFIYLSKKITLHSIEGTVSI